MYNWFLRLSAFLGRGICDDEDRTEWTRRFCKWKKDASAISAKFTGPTNLSTILFYFLFSHSLLRKIQKRNSYQRTGNLSPLYHTRNEDDVPYRGSAFSLSFGWSRNESETCFSFAKFFLFSPRIHSVRVNGEREIRMIAGELDGSRKRARDRLSPGGA